MATGFLSFWIAMPIAIIVTMLFGLLVGSVSLRLRADYFAIATIAAAEAVRIFAQNADSITGGNQPLFGYDSSFEAITEGIEDFLESTFGWDTPLYTGFVIVCWTTLFISAFVLTRMQRTPWGRVLRAVREDEDAARALGKNSFSYKLQSLLVSSFFGALGGGFLAMYFGVINPNNFEPAITFLAYGVLILGGLASYWGVLAGRNGSVVLDRVHSVPGHRAVRAAGSIASLHGRRPRPDPSHGVPAAGHLRQEGGDGPR